MNFEVLIKLFMWQQA